MGLQFMMTCGYMGSWFVKILSGRARKSRKYSPTFRGLAGALPILDKSGSFWSINTISTKRKGNCYENTNQNLPICVNYNFTLRSEDKKSR